MVAFRYGFSARVEKDFTRLVCSLVKHFSTLKDKFCISTRPYYFRYVLTMEIVFRAT